MSANPVTRDRSHHVNVKFRFLHERVRAGKINLCKYWGPLNVSDALTNSPGLPRPAFHKHTPFMEHAALTCLSPTRVPRSSFPVFLASYTSSPLPRH